MDTTYDIGTVLKDAVGLELQPVYILGSNTIPESSVPLTTYDRCIAKVMFWLAGHGKRPAIYLSEDQVEKGCAGGMTYCGFCEANPMIKYFIANGTPEYRNGMAEYLRVDPETAEESAARTGKKKAPKENLLFVRADKVKELNLKENEVLAITCFGTAEQIRNLSALVHYRNTDIFQNVITAVGPACSTLVTYPAGLAENAPKNSAYTGPADPTGNEWFPPNYMAIGIPIKLAKQMAEDVPKSFLTLRPQVAIPTERVELYAPER